MAEPVYCYFTCSACQSALGIRVDWRASTDLVALACRHCGAISGWHRVYAEDTGAKWDLRQEGLHEAVHEAISAQPEAEAARPRRRARGHGEGDRRMSVVRVDALCECDGFDINTYLEAYS